MEPKSSKLSRECPQLWNSIHRTTLDRESDFFPSKALQSISFQIIQKMVRRTKLSCLLLLTSIFQVRISLQTESAKAQEIPSSPKTIDQRLAVNGNQSKRWLHVSQLILHRKYLLANWMPLLLRLSRVRIHSMASQAKKTKNGERSCSRNCRVLTLNELLFERFQSSLSSLLLRGMEARVCNRFT